MLFIFPNKNSSFVNFFLSFIYHFSITNCNFTSAIETLDCDQLLFHYFYQLHFKVNEIISLRNVKQSRNNDYAIYCEQALPRHLASTWTQSASWAGKRSKERGVDVRILVSNNQILILLKFCYLKIITLTSKKPVVCVKLAQVKTGFKTFSLVSFNVILHVIMSISSYSLQKFKKINRNYNIKAPFISVTCLLTI